MIRLEKDLINQNTAYSIIKLNDLPVGFAKVIHYSNLHNLAKVEESELETIYVLPEYKGMRIGKFAINEITKAVKERDKKIVFLCVIDTNTNAVSFYKKLGFKFHSKTTLDIPYLKGQLKGMDRLYKELKK